MCLVAEDGFLIRLCDPIIQILLLRVRSNSTAVTQDSLVPYLTLPLTCWVLLGKSLNVQGTLSLNSEFCVKVGVLTTLIFNVITVLALKSLCLNRT